MTTLITPGRAADIRRAAHHHAAGMLMVSLGEWEPQKYNPESASNDAEEELLREEVERIAGELRTRALVGTHANCGACDRPYTVKGDGTIRRHFGLTAAGFSTGNPCPGADKPAAA
ncbi:hypothetical protein [Streptomyces aureus]|uniref:hypothetical protein n=1 Tax=Streptomyces aureus TaxID=193461 RepID=UPI00056420DD|nr:hypothetical protein [Streptomyces aureus]